MEVSIVPIFISVTLLVASIHGQAPNTDLQELASRSADFGTALYRKLASMSDDNVVVSPLAATLGLAALAAGAGGETRSELLQGLGLASMEKDGETDRIPRLLQQLRETAAQIVATSLFSSQQVQTESSFSSQVKAFYGADVQSVNFASAQTAKSSINDFVRSRTGSMIREVVNNVDPASQLTLISAAYFTGQWQLPFSVNSTQEDRFFVDNYNIVQVPMMTRSDKYYLAYDPSLKVGILKLPCTDGIAMLVLLPDEDVDYTFIDDSLTTEVFVGWVSKLKKTKLEVQLPRFSVEQTFSLKKNLRSLGITKIFESGADLSGISSFPDLTLSEAVQKVSVEVDEKGGPSTYVLMDNLPPRLTFNRPFHFIVYHEATKSLLHMGRVVDPTKK
uniref:Serpin peptidase inhibitor, clade A (alpha-1 antiproteinase, antitrypsin), member 10a n=1 Tax=Astyanax mexicanus TaxID=7994 RepID=W5KHQ1_ASTMX